VTSALSYLSLCHLGASPFMRIIGAWGLILVTGVYCILKDVVCVDNASKSACLFEPELFDQGIHDGL
jgi:hypothetical protein